MAGEDHGANIDARESKLPPFSGVSYKILLIHTWDETFLLLKLMLERFGKHEVVSHNKPETTLAVVRAFKPDVIGSHDNMAGMDGLAVYGQVQADPAFAAIPWILITARSLPEDFDPYLAVGFKDWVILPVGPRELVPVFDAWGRYSQIARARQK